MLRITLIGAALALCTTSALHAEPRRTAPAASTDMMSTSQGCVISTGDSLNFARLGVMRDTGIPSGGGGIDTGDGTASPTREQTQQDAGQDQLQDNIDAASANTSSNTAVGDGPGKTTSGSGTTSSSGNNGVLRGPCPKSH